ncbi:hypothetical protein [Actinophytocola sp.]|nr:hypothetical protein [Actinophytocola sp.]
MSTRGAAVSADGDGSGVVTPRWFDPVGSATPPAGSTTFRSYR